MYTVEAISTGARSAMNHIETPREREPIAGPFYLHPYGGIARDISVTREGFMRFFELEEQGILIAESWAGQGKLFDEFHEDGETMGYIGLLPGGEMTYSVTIIKNTLKDVNKLLEIAPYLWEGRQSARVREAIQNSAN